MEIVIKDIEHIREAAHEFIEHIGDHRVFAFYGKMGAGKTTFVKAICEELGVEDVITSPTFAIINEYSLPLSPSIACHTPTFRWEKGSGDSEHNELPFPSEGAGGRLFHFDFYRIKRLEEVYDMGYEDYFYSGALCFIEWPELIEDILPDDAVRVSITEQDDCRRVVSF